MSPCPLPGGRLTYSPSWEDRESGWWLTRAGIAAGLADPKGRAPGMHDA
jgi:hypothetical protein